MAPKKEKQQKQTLSLGAFLQDDQFGGGGSWADEVEDTYGSQPLPAPTRAGYTSSYSGGGGYSSGGMMGGYHVRDSYPTQLPDRPPYTAHLGNLSYEATDESVNDFFADCEITSVRIIEDRIEQRPKGFAYAEFATVDGLKKALTLDGESFQGRSIRVKIADPPKDRGDDRGDMARSLSSWERKGPLADAPSRGGGGGGFERRSDFGERRGPPRDGPPEEARPSRDFGNWERKGPLSPVQPEAQPGSRESSRPDTQRKERRVSPATWGEGRSEGSRPPREFKERAERPERPERPERAPTAAEMDNQWRNNMKPAAAKPASPQGSEAPTSPAPAPAQPASRPKLNLAKRTVSEAPESPATSAGGDAKASPFGAARPIDTAAKEREIADKKIQEAKEKKEQEEKAKEEKRLAKEAEEKAAAEAEQAKAEAEEKAKVEAEKKTEEKPEASDAPAAGEAETAEQKVPAKPKETVQNPKSRASEAGNWRSSSGGERGGRGGGYQNARGRGGEGRGRGGAPRGARNFENRPPRANGSPAASQQPAQPSSPAPAAEAEAAAPADPDGWTTVPAKGRRNQSTRA